MDSSEGAEKWLVLDILLRESRKDWLMDSDTEWETYKSQG